MPKEVQPLENAAKIYYAATFPPELSLLLLERKSTTLQHMLIDCLEVEENLKRSQILLGQESGGEIKDTLKLVGPYKQKGRVPVQLNISLARQEDDQPDIEIDGFADLFSKGCNLLSTGSVNDDFKRDLGVPVYDEYEEEYMEAILEKLVIEPRFANVENKAAIQIQKVEIGKHGECAGGDSLPLCYSSFELIWHMIKASKQKHKLEDMVHSIDLCGTEDDKEEQPCSPSLLIDT